MPEIPDPGPADPPASEFVDAPLVDDPADPEDALEPGSSTDVPHRPREIGPGHRDYVEPADEAEPVEDA